MSAAPPDRTLRVALVTGAGQGVGRQIALHLAAHNAGGVIVNDFVRDRAESVAEEPVAGGVKLTGTFGRGLFCASNTVTCKAWGNSATPQPTAALRPKR